MRRLRFAVFFSTFVLAMTATVPAMFVDTSDYDVVVIGAGGGGLAAAARLALGGMKVLLIEQHYKVGGYMTNFYRGDYTFEVSLHAFDGLDDDGMNVSAFTDLGIINKVTPVKLSPMYHAVYPDGYSITVPADADEYCELLKQDFPQEAEGIDGLFRTLEGLNGFLAFTTKLGDGKILEAFSSVRLWMFLKILKYWKATLTDMLDDHIKDQRLIAVITQLSGFGGEEPNNISAIYFAAMWNSYHRGGFYYFEGGSQSISNALAEVIQENGGTVMLSTRATKIVIEDGKAVAVKTDEGDEFSCRYVVSNANAPATFNTLVGAEHLPDSYMEELEDLTVGLSMVQVYMGVDYDYSDYFPQGVHEFIPNVTYDQAEAFRYMHEGNSEKVPFAILNYTLPDPGTAPEGKNVICLGTILPYDWEEDWYVSDIPTDAITAATNNPSHVCEGYEEDYEAYTALKEEVASILISRAEEYLPGLSSHIEVMEVGTPRTMEYMTLNPGGSIFGWDNTPEQSLLNRLPQKTPIDNLYLAGAWTFPGGGQSAVLASGRMAALKILAREK